MRRMSYPAPTEDTFEPPANKAEASAQKIGAKAAAVAGAGQDKIGELKPYWRELALSAVLVGMTAWLAVITARLNTLMDIPFCDEP